MHIAAVIPVGEGRLENLTCCLTWLGRMVERPPAIILVGDGEEGTQVAELALDRTRDLGLDIEVLAAPKHEPGMDQPRNRGVRRIQEINTRNAMLRQGYPVTHVWFIDTDLIFDAGAFKALREALDADPKRVLVGPYEWMPPGSREPLPDLHNDPRTQSFAEHPVEEVLVEDISAGLACFSGNLVWPIDEFVRIGGFWNELNHGRCEDGELGLRAVACGIGISFVAAARAWHISHPINYELTIARNERDVPMINERHPWVEGEGLFVVEEDGKRFNVRCRCGWEGNTAEIWNHQAGCDLA
jgi:hypothetical protein